LYVDQLVDRACAVLRLLFLSDLRTCQSTVNELLILAQEFTADPKTDAKLGKVGAG
jgi:RLL motif-containing protein 1